MKVVKIIAAVLIVSFLSVSCGSDAGKSPQPIDSTNNIVLPEDRTSDSMGSAPGSSSTADSARMKRDSVNQN